MPLYCPRCRAEYQDDAQICWKCRARLVAELDPAQEPGWVELRPVYRAPDEFSALAVQRVLAEAEIECLVQSAMVPWTDGIMQNIRGYWGEVLVAVEDLAEAREIVDDYLRSLESEGGSDAAEADGGTEAG